LVFPKISLTLKQACFSSQMKEVAALAEFGWDFSRPARMACRFNIPGQDMAQ
jgi:hypothetical protein